MDKFNSPDYKRSRKSYVVQCTAEYLVSLLVTDVYLAKLLSSIGMSDAMVGIISSIVSIAFIFQILTLFIVKIKASSKKLVLIFDTISIFCFMLVYITPFLHIQKIFKTVLLIVCILLAYLCKYLILNICYKWANSYVSPTRRARFSAGKEMISLFTGMFFTAAVGFVIDVFEAHDNLNGGFLFISSAILILNICNFISLSLIKKDSVTEPQNDVEPLSVVLRNTLGNKNFQSVIILTVLYDVARYFSIGFLGIFKYKELMMTVFLVQLVNILGNLARLAISKPIGKYSDKKSFVKGFKLGLYLLAAAFFINIFTTRSTWYLIIVYTILYNCSLAGTNNNSFNIVYSYIDSKYIIRAMAIKNCIGGVFGFGASVLGGKILDAVQSGNNIVFGIHISGQQILSLISLVIVVIAILFISKVVEKQKIIIQ